MVHTVPQQEFCPALVHLQLGRKRENEFHQLVVQKGQPYFPAMSHAVPVGKPKQLFQAHFHGVEIENIVQFGDDGFVDAFPFPSAE